MKTLSLGLAGLALLLLASPGQVDDRKDILVADFEGQDYGAWKAVGEAFGTGPARGTLPGQMPVSGYLGKGLVNSFKGGDGSTGTLTSPPFQIQRQFLNFLIGGGKHSGKTCINLLLDGKVVRTASGPNDRPGGSEHLHWHGWNVADLSGKMVVIQIVDHHTGGWGHINIDHIFQSDHSKEEKPAARELLVQNRFLLFPVKTGAPKRRLRLELEQRTVGEFEIELTEDKPDLWAVYEAASFAGKKLKILVDFLPSASRALEAIAQSDHSRDAQALYHEKHRPQFHFTSRRGWLNDPNGLVYYKGEYHLFYQHNPYGWSWGNMHWGHAVSKDLVHWQELPIALYPQKFGDWCFSGSALVDRHNLSGFRKGVEEVLIAAYTSTGRGECIAYSNDRGRTWTDYRDNPVVKHQGRDPRILWHEPSRSWVMAVYDEFEGKRYIAFYTSPELRKWTFQSRIGGFYECPDLIELPVDGDRTKAKWALYAADGKYVLGNFDGKSFHVESGKHQLWYGNFYAAQTFSNSPAGRCIQIGWGAGISFPGMPFNQQMTIPCQLTLRSTAEGTRLFAEPVEEVKSLRRQKREFSAPELKPGTNLLADIKGELFDIAGEFELAGAESWGFNIRGTPVVYDVRKQEISCQQHRMPLKANKNKVGLRLLVDQGSIEIFGNSGQQALSVGVLLPAENQSLQVFCRGGNVRVPRLEVFALSSVWK